MRAVGFARPGAIDHDKALEDIELPRPEPGPRDLLVAVEAVSVNPVDAKLRQRVIPEIGHKVLGYDAAGRVEAVGAEVESFQPGDEVWYAGDNRRQGSNAEFQLVDERLVACKPASLDMARAAALPLTTLTAWESLVDRLTLTPETAAGKSLLVVGGAGGVGSVAIQIAARYLGMVVIATAGSDASMEWCLRMGARDIVDYHHGLAEPVRATGLDHADAVLLAVQPDRYWAEVCELVAPFGGIAGIVDSAAPLDMNLLKPKSAAFHWEFMFAPANYGVRMERQGAILAEATRLVDAGVLESTVTEHIGPICAERLIEAHRRIESGRTRGKLVLAGWP